MTTQRANPNPSGYVCRNLSGRFSDGGSTPPASTMLLDHDVPPDHPAGEG